MDVRQVRAFVEAASAGAVGRAAERLHVSQSALSRQIQSLESEVGVQLFDRIGRTVRLSAAGAALLPRCRDLLTAERDILEAGDSIRSGLSGTLSIGATPQTIERLIVPFIGLFTPAHPGVELVVREAGGSQAFELVAGGDLRVGVAVSRADSGLDQRHLLSFTLCASGQEAVLGSGDGPVALEEVADLPVLVLGGSFGSRRLFDTTMEAAGLSPHIAFESSAPDAVLSLAAAGHGVAVLPSSVQVRGRSLVTRPMADRTGPLTLDLVAVTHPEAHDPGFVAAAVDLLAATAASIPG